MIKVAQWLVKKLWFSDQPTCICGWSMKPIEKGHVMNYTWHCITRKCNWEAFEDDMGKLHWWEVH